MGKAKCVASWMAFLLLLAAFAACALLAIKARPKADRPMILIERR